jgi:hypothetical protein
MHDYDDFLKRSESGLFCGEELARMVERIKDFWIVPPASAAARDRTRAWLAEHNRLEKVCSRLAELIDTMR